MPLPPNNAPLTDTIVIVLEKLEQARRLLEPAQSSRDTTDIVSALIQSTIADLQGRKPN